MSGHVAVVDYGMGNLRSVAKGLERVAPASIQVEVTADPAAIARAGRVVFPGVGALRDCMAELDRLGLHEAVLRAASTKPFLGICLGLQALLEGSEEAEGVPGLGVLPGRVRRFDPARRDTMSGARLKVPHMGWNQVYPVMEHPIFQGIPDGERFYFVHSYYAEPARPEVVAASTDYGGSFASALARDALVAVQFHPEKSQQAGLRLLDNFLHWDGDVPLCGSQQGGSVHAVDSRH